MTPTYATKLGVQVQKTNVGAQNNNASTTETYGMVLASFKVINKQGRAWFFRETFLLTYTSIDMVLRMLFIAFSNANIHFAEEKLIWRSYTTRETLPTNQRVEFIDRKEFAKTALDKNVEAFVVYVASLTSEMSIYPAREAQISLLRAEKITIPVEYADYANVFLK